MFLDGSDFVTKPDGNLVNAFAGGDQQTCECMSHLCGKLPFAVMRSHVLHKRSPKIVAIKPLPWVTSGRSIKGARRP